MISNIVYIYYLLNISIHSFIHLFMVKHNQKSRKTKIRRKTVTKTKTTVVSKGGTTKNRVDNFIKNGVYQMYGGPPKRGADGGIRTSSMSDKINYV